MKNRGRLAILFIPAFILAGLVAMLALLRQNEGPEFNGRTLHNWMQDLHPYSGTMVTLIQMPTQTGFRPVTTVPATSVGVLNPAYLPNFAASTNRASAEHAIYEIGTNAIPYLVNYYLDQKKSQSHGIISIQWHTKLWLLNQKFAPTIPIVPPVLDFKHEFARAALVALNEKSVYALPFVLGLVKDEIMSTQEEKAFYKFLVNHQNKIRSPISDQMVEEALLQMSDDTEEFNSEQWILYLWTVQLRNVGSPELVPKIIPILTHSNGMVQFQAIRSIGQFGTNALAALPVLETILDDQNYQAALAAKKAIKKIRPSSSED